MTFLPPVLALLGLAVAAPADEASVVARVDGRDLDAEAFGAWLVERFGVHHVDQFATERAILAAADERGLLPDDEEVAAAWQAERAEVIERQYHGDTERYERDLLTRGIDPEQEEARRRAAMRVDLALARMARADRVVDEADLRARYASIYMAGESVAVDVLFFNAYRTHEPDAPLDLAALRQEALGRAETAFARLQEGATPADLEALSDPVPSEFVVDGRVHPWRRDLLGPEVDRAIRSLDRPGDVSPPILVWDGYYVVQLVERRPVSFEEARPSLEAMLRADPPTLEELAVTRTRIIEDRGVEILLR